MQRVYSKGSKPQYFVLKPQIDEKGARFVMTKLPYADEVRDKYHHCIKPEIEHKETDLDEEETIFNNFCQSVDIFSDKCCKDFPLTPNMTIDTFTEAVIEEAARKICNKESEFTETQHFNLESELDNEYVKDLRQMWLKSKV